MKTVVIRCSASPTVGFGHLVRCRVLAEEVVNRGYRAVMIGPDTDLKDNKDEQFFYDWIPRSYWLSASEEASFHLKLMKRYDAKYIIIDDYNSDGIHQKILRDNGIKVVQQYDASKPQKFAANIVVNGSPYENKGFYDKNAIYKDIKYLLGPKYSILRSEFKDIKSLNLAKEKRVLMTFGGGSDRGAILKILENCKYLFERENWKVSIVVGKNNDNIHNIKDFITSNNCENVELHISPQSMARIMSICSFAILGGGTTISEAAFLGIPALLIPIASNQINQCIGWNNIGGMIYLSDLQSLDVDLLKATLAKVLSKPEEIDGRRAKLASIIDSEGHHRILDELLN